MFDSLRTDCIHFQWDRPCKFHKLEKRNCNECKDYKKIGEKILIIKLAALGDVIRTTSLLEPIFKVYKNAYIVWLTEKVAAPLIEENPYINEIWVIDEKGIISIQNFKFDLVLAPDCDRESAMLSSIALTKERRGFFWDQNSNKVIPTNRAASFLLKLSHDDNLKKNNKKTYQETIYEICNLPKNPIGKILFYPKLGELNKLNHLIEKSNSDISIGFITASGNRWPQKAWPSRHFGKLALLLLKKYPNIKIVLLEDKGGEEINNKIVNFVRKKMRINNRISRINTSKSVRLFGSIFHFLDIVVTGDTLGLHLALAANCRVVVLLGPTSANELELYGKGHIINTPLNCSCCYLTNCKEKPNCMDVILPETVFSKLEYLMNETRNRKIK